MSRKHFSWLLAVTIIVTAIVMLMPGKTGRESEFEKHLLLPALADSVNQVEFFRVTGPGNTVVATLQREGDRWVALNESSYPANWDVLRQMLSDLSQAEVIEQKTAIPEFYSRLGVEDISLEDASGLQVDFGDDSDIPALIIGKPADGRQGRYVRLRDSETSALIDRGLEIPLDAMSWLDREIIDISDAGVVEVTITHPDGEHIVISKISADDADFILQDIPDGREIASSWTVNSMGGLLDGLTLDAVAADTAVDWTGAVGLMILGADGLRVEANLVAEPDNDEARWIRLRAVAVEPGAADETVARAGEINERIAGWAYQIPLYKYDSMTRHMEDFLKAVTEDTP